MDWTGIEFGFLNGVLFALVSVLDRTIVLGYFLDLDMKVWSFVGLGNESCVF